MMLVDNSSFASGMYAPSRGSPLSSLCRIWVACSGQASPLGSAVEDAASSYSAHLAVRPEQPSRLDRRDLRVAMDRLSAVQREVPILIGAKASHTRSGALRLRRRYDQEQSKSRTRSAC
jgi:hypothetical protein